MNTHRTCPLVALFNALTYRNQYTNLGRQAGLTGRASIDFGPTPGALLGSLVLGYSDAELLAQHDRLMGLAALRRQALHRTRVGAPDGPYLAWSD